MREWILPLLAGAATGILSAWGIGGGTLLLLIMTLFLGVDQVTAQGINLLYFLPTASMALVQHRKSGLLDKTLLRRSIPWGLPVAVGASLLSTAVDTSLLQKPFGIFLLAAGLYTILQKNANGK